MPGTPVGIGPFSGGLNTNEDPSIIADNQMAECVNFDIGRAGELMIRPGLKYASAVGTGSAIVLGAARRTAGAYRQYARSGSQLYLSDTNADSWVTFGTTDSGLVEAMVQFVDPVNTTVPYAFFIPKGTGSTTATAGQRQNLVDNTMANITGMPNGSGAIGFRDRLFIYGATNETSPGSYRIWYSTERDYTTFGANNFIDVGAGDGEYVTSMAIQNDSLIIFKENSSWVLTFEGNPGFGVLRKFNSEIGATGVNSVVTFENQLYVIDQRAIYRLINLLYEDISIPINIGKGRSFLRDSAVVMGRRMLFTVSASAFTPARQYVFHTDLSAWSRYSFPVDITRFVSTGQNIEEKFLGYVNGSTEIYRYNPYATDNVDWGDAPNNITTCVMTTKQYTFDSPSTFKRIHWWMVEAIGKGSLRAVMDVDGGSQATVNVLSAATSRAYKLFVRNRFRKVQFTLQNEPAAHDQFSIHGVQAFISNKGKVIAGVTA